MYEFTSKLSELLTHEPSRWEYGVLRCLADDPAQMQRFLGITSGSTDYFAFRRELPRYVAHYLYLRVVRRPSMPRRAVNEVRSLFDRSRRSGPLGTSMTSRSMRPPGVQE
jgi:hypothetical protein